MPKKNKTLPKPEVFIADPAILKNRREEFGLTQQKVADLAAISLRQYQRLESGERLISGTSFRIGMAIADILELDAHELVRNPTVEAYLKEKK